MKRLRKYTLVGFFGVALSLAGVLAAGAVRAEALKVMIDPSPIVVAPGQKVQLRPRLANLPPSIRLIWSLDAAGVEADRTGTLSRDFTPSYTAPDNPPDKPIYVQLLAIDDKQGIPIAGAKSKITFVSASGGGGAASQQQQQQQRQQQSGGGGGATEQSQQNTAGASGGTAGTSSGGSSSAGTGPDAGAKSGGMIWNDPVPPPPPPPSSGSSTPGVPRAPPGEWN